MQIEAPLFSLGHSLECGQVFGWVKRGEWCYGFIGGKPARVRQEKQTLFFEGVGSGEITNYFSLDEDLQAIYRGFGEDEHLAEAVKRFRGLRLVRQEPWECSVSFICASFANIPRIRKMLDCMRRKFGDAVVFKGVELHSFPSPSALAEANVEELEECGLGYRANYVREFARKVAGGGLRFGRLRKERYETARMELMKVKGIGVKVADCILLFSLGKGEAFPVDVWIERAVRRFYGVERKQGEWARKRFGTNAGYAQEYLYALARSHVKKVG